MKLRRFNEEGLQRMGAFLDSLVPDAPVDYPQDLLTDASLSEAIEPEVEVELRVFGSRFEAAKYLNDLFVARGITGIETDRGLWAWLALYYFEELCPASNESGRKPGERARWIPVNSDFRKYYRHLLAGPYRVYRAHRESPELVFPLLRNPLDKPGEVYEQLASRQELITNSAVVETVGKLYFEVTTREPKRGAAGRKAGSVRRLAEVLDQFDVTWDLQAIDTSSLLNVLPREFERFKRGSAQRMAR